MHAHIQIKKMVSLWDSGGYEHLASLWNCETAMGLRTAPEKNAAVSCINHRERFMQYWACPSEEERRRKPFWLFCCFLVWYFHDAFCTSRGLVGHENTRRWMVHCYKHINLPLLRSGEIFLYYQLLHVCAIPTYRVDRLYHTKAALGIPCIVTLLKNVPIGWIN